MYNHTLWLIKHFIFLNLVENEKTFQVSIWVKQMKVILIFVLTDRGKVLGEGKDEHTYLRQDLGLMVFSWLFIMPLRMMIIQVNICDWLNHSNHLKRIDFTLVPFNLF